MTATGAVVYVVAALALLLWLLRRPSRHPQSIDRYRKGWMRDE
jgi:uncharacterized membrane-anchored protein